MPKEFSLMIEQHDEGYLVAIVPELQDYCIQAKSLDELMEKLKEALESYLEPDEE